MTNNTNLLFIPSSIDSSALLHNTIRGWVKQLILSSMSSDCDNVCNCDSAAGLYYLAELVEEFSVISAKVIKYMILVWMLVSTNRAHLTNCPFQATLVIYLCLFLFEELPTSLILCGVFSHIMHLLIMRTFPYFDFTSIPFIASLGRQSSVIMTHQLSLRVWYLFSIVIYSAFGGQPLLCLHFLRHRLLPFQSGMVTLWPLSGLIQIISF